MQIYKLFLNWQNLFWKKLNLFLTNSSTQFKKTLFFLKGCKYINLYSYKPNVFEIILMNFLKLILTYPPTSFGTANIELLFIPKQSFWWIIFKVICYFLTFNNLCLELILTSVFSALFWACFNFKNVFKVVLSSREGWTGLGLLLDLVSLTCEFMFRAALAIPSPMLV